MYRVKAEFIRTKYQQMGYINRLKEETNETFEDLNLVKTQILHFYKNELSFFCLAITFDCSNG
jgi:hypothetical protein